MPEQPFPRALTIAGSDSGGCAGIQADLKTFAAMRVHGMSAITSVTAQDTRRVHSRVDLPLESIDLQIRAVMEDIGIDAAKTGMLPTAEIVGLISGLAAELGISPLVVDPVMVSTGGDPLSSGEAVQAMKRELLPLAEVVTPNIGEAERLAGFPIQAEREMERAVRTIFELGPRSVLITGGHLSDPEQSTDYFFDGRAVTRLPAARVAAGNTRGTGCTLAAAIAAGLAHGMEPEESVRKAKEFVTQAIRHGLPIGKGNGPLGHFWQQWER